MANLFVWLLAAAAPLAKRVLVSLGIGWVSYAGITAALGAVQNQIISYWGSMSADVSNILSLFGFGESLGIILGGMAARAALMAVDRLGKVTS